MMKRLVTILFLLSLVLGAIALVVPGFIDWSKHKGAILSQLEPYVQRKIEVGGAVKFRLLPSPQIMLQNVTLANPEGAKSASFVKLRQLEARMKLGPLLEGRFEVETINFAEPELHLEILPDGTNNWSGVFKQQEQGGGLTRKADAIQLNQISMTNGSLHYLNQITGIEWKAENLSLTVAADTLFGPYRANGEMLFNGNSVGLEIKTDKYVAGTPVPVNIAFLPRREMPQVRLNGVADLSAGFDLQTEIGISEGSLASLFGDKFLGDVEFLNENVELAGMLNLKGGEVTVENIDAKFGEKGELSGTLTARFSPGSKPEVTAELTGKNLKVSTKPVFPALPKDFTAHLKLTGYGIHWEGSYLPTASLTADSGAEEWTIRDVRIENLPGKGTIKLSGVVTPKSKYSAFSMTAKAEDLSKMLSAALLPESNILKALEKAGLVKGIDISCSLDLKADKISLFGIDATIDGATKVSGVLNIARGAMKPSFDAHLNFDKGDVAKPLSDEYTEFMGQVMKSDALLNITVKDFSKGEVSATDFIFKGNIKDGVLQVEKMTGNLGPSGSFGVTGGLSSFNPLGGMDFDYTLNAGQLGYLGSLGLEILPPLWGSNTAALSGKVQGDAQKYSFTADGKAEAAEVALHGTATKGNEGAYSYQTDVVMKNTTWAQIGLPLDRLLAKEGGFDFSAKLSGMRGHYTLADIKAGGVTGSLSRKESGYSGELTVDAIDFDSWVWHDWKVTDSIDLKLKGKKLTWRSTDISNPELQLEFAPSRIKVSRLRGDLWGGSVTADGQAEKIDKGWNGTMKGAVSGVDLQEFAGLMDLKGISVGRGDVSFDMTDDDAKTATDWFHGMEGSIEIKADKLTVERFSPGAVASLLTTLEGTSPENAGLQVTKALQSQPAIFENVSAKFTLGKGRAVFDGLTLSNSVSEVKAGGSYDLGPETYSIKAEVKLRKPAGVPVFTVSSSGETEKTATVYTVEGSPVVSWLKRGAAQEAPPVLETPPVEAVPAPQEEENATPPINAAPVSQEPLAAPQPVIISGEGQDEEGAVVDDDGIIGVIKRLDALPEGQGEPSPELPLRLNAPSNDDDMQEGEIFPLEQQGVY